MPKNKPALTETNCTEIENLRLAIEVLTGERVRYVHIDSASRRAKVIAGDEEKIVKYRFIGDTMLYFSFGFLGDYFTAQFEKPGEVKVLNNNSPLKFGYHIMWQVGRSATDRWTEPLFKQQLEADAQKRNFFTSFEAYLKCFSRL